MILSLTLGLTRSGAPTVRYAELAAAVGADPTLASVRHAILGLRRKKLVYAAFAVAGGLAAAVWLILL